MCDLTYDWIDSMTSRKFNRLPNGHLNEIQGGSDIVDLGDPQGGAAIDITSA